MINQSHTLEKTTAKGSQTSKSDVTYQLWSLKRLSWSKQHIIFSKNQLYFQIFYHGKKMAIVLQKLSFFKTCYWYSQARTPRWTIIGQGFEILLDIGLRLHINEIFPCEISKILIKYWLSVFAIILKYIILAGALRHTGSWEGAQFNTGLYGEPP